MPILAYRGLFISNIGLNRINLSLNRFFLYKHYLNFENFIIIVRCYIPIIFIYNIIDYLHALTVITLFLTIKIIFQWITTTWIFCSNKQHIPLLINSQFYILVFFCFINSLYGIINQIR